MKYTIRDGVERPFSARTYSNYRFILPLLVILAGVLFFVIGPHASKNAGHPLTLGIYTVKTSDPNKNDSNKDKRNKNNNSPSSSGGIALSGGGLSPASSLSLGSGTSGSGSTIASAVSPVVTGGMGGGGGSTNGGGTTTTTPTPPPTPTTTACVDQLTHTATVCVFPYQACTVPLVGVIGYKTVDGTCIVIN